MAFGYRGNPDWRDMSEYVVHFTKADGERSTHENMMSILASGCIRAVSRFGAARGLDAIEPPQECVCFSEIPLDRLDRLVERRNSSYGVGFHQDVILNAGGGRVWYLDKGPQRRAIRTLIRDAVGPPFDAQSPVWDLTPLIDFPGDYPGGPYRFEWEREWRTPGDLEFAPEDVAFLFLPDEEHERARAFFEGAERDGTGPNYDCPFLDPRWADWKLQAAFGEI